MLDQITEQLTGFDYFVLSLLFIFVGVIALLLWRLRVVSNRRWVLEFTLADLAGKSQIEQELSLATTDQLMAELTNRYKGFITILVSDAPDEPDNPRMRIYIKGIPEINACELMKDVIGIVSNNRPTGTF